MAAPNHNDRRYRGGQFCCWTDLASNIRLRFAELHRRRHRRLDSRAGLGIFEAESFAMIDMEGERSENRDALIAEKQTYERIHSATKTVLAEVGLETKNEAAAPPSRPPGS